MKSLLVILSLVIGTTAFAEAPARQGKMDIARYQVNLSFEDQVQVATVTLKNNAKLTIEVTTYDQPWFGSAVSKQTFNRKLSKTVFNALADKVKTLANTKLETTYSDVVCMMMPGPGANSDLYTARGFDYQTGTYAAGLELVLTGPGCWRYEHVAPQDAWTVDAANALKAQLEILAIHYVAGRI